MLPMSARLLTLWKVIQHLYAKAENGWGVSSVVSYNDIMLHLCKHLDLSEVPKYYKKDNK